jgi:NADH dehydrogenase [ubiquinone] 1 alpha subcomplex assembly factor 3
MSWNIERVQDINEQSLSLFPLLEPKIDILVLGTGDHHMAPDFTKTMFEFMKKHKITMEVLPSEQACTTYNFLASEGRIVGAAIIPPLNLHVSEDDFSGYMLNRQRTWELTDF